MLCRIAPQWMTVLLNRKIIKNRDVMILEKINQLEQESKGSVREAVKDLKSRLSAISSKSETVVMYKNEYLINALCEVKQTFSSLEEHIVIDKIIDYYICQGNTSGLLRGEELLYC